MLNNQPIEFICPGCQTQHQKSLSWANVADDFICKCGKRFQLDRAQLQDYVREVEEAVQNLSRQIQHLFGMTDAKPSKPKWHSYREDMLAEISAATSDVRTDAANMAGAVQTVQLEIMMALVKCLSESKSLDKKQLIAELVTRKTKHEALANTKSGLDILVAWLAEGGK